MKFRDYEKIIESGDMINAIDASVLENGVPKDMHMSHAMFLCAASEIIDIRNSSFAPVMTGSYAHESLVAIRRNLIMSCACKKDTDTFGFGVIEVEDMEDVRLLAESDARIVVNKTCIPKEQSIGWVLANTLAPHTIVTDTSKAISMAVSMRKKYPYHSRMILNTAFHFFRMEKDIGISIE